MTKLEDKLTSGEAIGSLYTSPQTCYTPSPTTSGSEALPRDFARKQSPATRVSGYFPAVTSHPAIGKGSAGILHGNTVPKP
jgi:hypothetical protein